MFARGGIFATVLGALVFLVLSSVLFPQLPDSYHTVVAGIGTGVGAGLFKLLFVPSPAKRLHHNIG